MKHPFSTYCAFYLPNKCKATTNKTCKVGCSFYKTNDELKKGRNKATKRILSLPFEQQIYIADKYASLYANGIQE